MLSVATAPVDARQRRVAIAVAFTLGAICFALFPLAATPLPPSPAPLPFLLGIALASDFVTAYLLLSQFLASRLLGAAYLAGAYVLGGLGTLAYVASFPGVAGGLFAPQISPWLWVWWHLAFPGGVIVALVSDREKQYARAKEDARHWARAIGGGALALGFAVAAVLVALGPALPAIVRGDSYAGGWTSALGEIVVLVNLVALALAVIWTQGRTVLHTWLIVALVASVLDVQISLAGNARFTVGWYLARVLVVCASTAVLYAYLRQMHVLFGRLSDISMIDGLTEIPNRRYFEIRLHDAIRGALRHARPLGLVMADVDNFKQYNDAYGHVAGDEALKAVAATLRLCAKRPADVVARWGGEEFVMILPETDRDGAYLVAERLRATLAGLAIPHRGTSVPGGILTVSVGLTLLGGRRDDGTTMLQRADAALYRAKETGRNTVAVELPPLALDPPDVAEEPLFLGLEIEGA